MWAVTPGQMLTGPQDVRGRGLRSPSYLILDQGSERVWVLASIMQGLGGRASAPFLDLSLFYCINSTLLIKNTFFKLFI